MRVCVFCTMDLFVCVFRTMDKFVCSVLWICLCVIYHGYVCVFCTMDMFVCSVLRICLCVKRELSESSTTGLIDTNGPKMDAAFVCLFLACFLILFVKNQCLKVVKHDCECCHFVPTTLRQCMNKASMHGDYKYVPS